MNSAERYFSKHQKGSHQTLLDAAVEQRMQAEQVWLEDLGPDQRARVDGGASLSPEKVPSREMAGLAAAPPRVIDQDSVASQQ